MQSSYKTGHLSLLCRIPTRLGRGPHTASPTSAAVAKWPGRRPGRARALQGGQSFRPRPSGFVFQQYTVKRAYAASARPGPPAPAPEHRHQSAREGRRKQRRRCGGKGVGGALKRRGAQRREGPRTKARGPGRAHRSPGTASWRAGTARSARRSPLGPERRVRAPARSPSASRGCGWRWSGRPRRLRAAAVPASCRAPPEEPEPRVPGGCSARRPGGT